MCHNVESWLNIYWVLGGGGGGRLGLDYLAEPGCLVLKQGDGGGGVRRRSRR